MDSFLSVLTKYRNVCAHGECLFSYKTVDSISDTSLHEKLKLPKKGNQYIKGKQDLFVVVIVFRYLLPNSDFLTFKRKLIMEDINKANMFMNNNVVDTEYFLLFKEKNNDIIMKRIRQLINSFASAGLNSHQVTNDDLRIILDNFLNGGQTTTFGTVMA